MNFLSNNYKIQFILNIDYPLTMRLAGPNWKYLLKPKPKPQVRAQRNESQGSSANMIYLWSLSARIRPESCACESEQALTLPINKGCCSWRYLMIWRWRRPDQRIFLPCLRWYHTKENTSFTYDFTKIIYQIFIFYFFYFK